MSKENYIDKKRIAICEGVLSREGLSYVKAQVVDIGIQKLSDLQKPWNYLNSIFQGEEKTITPFLDFNLAPVRKPTVKVEIVDLNEKLIIEPILIKGNDDGFFYYEIQKKIPEGFYQYKVFYQGTDSYLQYTKDLAHLNKNPNSFIVKKELLGIGKMRILSDTYAGVSIISDIDQTFLATEIESYKGKFSALFETCDQKRSIPGMAELFKRFREENSNAPLRFISASPHFFRRMFQSTFDYQGVVCESLHLKYLDGTIKNFVSKINQFVLNPGDLFKQKLSKTFDRIKKFTSSSFQSLFDHFSYKLIVLLEKRLLLPKNSKEILIGDNTENDYYIFLFYQLIISDLIGSNTIEDFLYKLKLGEKNSITRDDAKRIRQLGKKCVETHGPINSVQLVLINETKLGISNNELLENLKLILPKNILIEHLKTTIQLPILTRGAIGMGVILHSDGLLKIESVLMIIQSMIGSYWEGEIVDEKFMISFLKDLKVPESSKEKLKEISNLLESAFRS